MAWHGTAYMHGDIDLCEVKLVYEEIATLFLRALKPLGKLGEVFFNSQFFSERAPQARRF